MIKKDFMKNNIINENFDNGGANAKKGFHYQDAIALLIIISNFSKNDFTIYFECRDDIEVDVENNKIFIQVKSEKQTISKLTKTSKTKAGTEKKSTLYKSLNKNNDKSSRYKIATTNFEDGKLNQRGLVFNEISAYSNEQKQEIIQKLKEQGLNEKEVKEKLKNSFVFVSPFKDNFEEACTFLLGLMAECKICVDNGRGKELLYELINSIQIKSEKKVNAASDVEKKKICKKDLEKLSKTEKCYKEMESIVDRLENKGFIEFGEKIKIDNLIRIIDLKHKTEIKMVEVQDVKFDITNKVEDEINNIHVEISKKVDIDKLLLYAILIDKYVMDIIKGET